MMSEIANELREITQKHGEFSFNIPLAENVWTKGCFGGPHNRLIRILQTTSDVMTKPLSDCRILDLGCLDGLFSLEFALHGCAVIGLDVREPNIARARFCARVMNLKNVEFVEDDARNISVEKYGKFDAVICSGLLYHLSANDAIMLIQRMYEMAERAIIVDTHISLEGGERFNSYAGHTYSEHPPEASKEEKLLSLWASADNETSFWFTRPSLINILTGAGFSSVHECFTHAYVDGATRCTFVAIKATKVAVHTRPAGNELKVQWPEGSLSYSPLA
jgi:SAM-dependent methyltransferase